MKMLFLQEFSMIKKGGGVAILKQLIAGAPSFGFDVKILCDASVNSEIIPSNEALFPTIKRNYRYGIGRIIGFFLGLGFDRFARKKLLNQITKENPDYIHITAHGLCFTVCALAAKRSGKKTVISVHDLWHLTVKSYLPEWICHLIFKSALRHVSTVYVISPQMAEYMEKRYGKRNYQVIHDGARTQRCSELPPPATEIISFLYVGLIHKMQERLFNTCIDAMGAIQDRQFRIGICSNTTFVSRNSYSNVELINYGWQEESVVRKISKKYSYGLLPLSFDQEDALFYRTSFMTKIPFYIGACLPIVCIGPADSSAAKMIKAERIGFTITSPSPASIKEQLLHLVALPSDEFMLLKKNLIQSAENTFNINIIRERFYMNAGV